MKFIAYQKIPTDTSQYDLTKKEENHIFKEIKWIALEKVNGANFSVYCDGIDVKFAKRTGFIEENQWFYSYETISESLTEKILLLHKYLKSIYSEMDYIILYGELCGGFYPENPNKWEGLFNSNRVNDKNECILPQEERAIQEGIYYSPNIEYIVFDISLINKTNDGGVFFNYDTIMEYCAKFNFNYLKPLFTGSFTQCMNYNYKFDSIVGVEVFGHPKLPNGTNIAEGIVIKPNECSINIKLKKGDNKNIRPLVKLKHPLFAEISGDFTLPEVTANMRLSSMANNNRLNCLLSKIGELNKSNRDEVLDAYLDDIWNDFWERWPDVKITHYDESKLLLHNKAKKIIEKYLENMA
jgi:Rnl2 family RNA ligase